MADIGGDGNTTVQKLEGSQIHFRATRSLFMASEVPSMNWTKLATASEETRGIRPHVVWAVRPMNGSWWTEKPLQWCEIQEARSYTLSFKTRRGKSWRTFY